MAKAQIREVEEVNLLGENGQPRTMRRVWFVTPRGTPASVDIDPNDWTQEKITDAIMEKSKELDSVFDLDLEIPTDA